MSFIPPKYAPQVEKIKEFLTKSLYKKFKVWHLIIIILIIGSAPDDSTSSSSSTSSRNSSSSSSSSTSINGTYTNKGSSITISGNQWFGKLAIETGFGAAYDEQNAQYSSGKVKAKDLYDESGYVKIGYVTGNSLKTSIGGQRITLRK